MGKKTRTFSINQEHGQVLLQIVKNFSLPEKLSDLNYTPEDRAQGADDVRHLLRSLKEVSPLLKGSRRLIVFGPPDSWEEKSKDNFQLADRGQNVEIQLPEAGRMGAYYCLLLGLHPESKPFCDILSQEEALWPLAESLGGLHHQLRKDLKLDRPHRRIDFEETPEEEKTGKESEKVTGDEGTKKD